MNPFESTIESPLRFFNSYFRKDGESFLYGQFVRADEIDFQYIPQRDAIYVQKRLIPGYVRGVLLEEETNICEYELTFPEYVEEEIERQLQITIELIYTASTCRSDDLKLDFYKQILIEGLAIKKQIETQPDFNFKYHLDLSIFNILKYANVKFEKYHPGLPQLLAVKKYYKGTHLKNDTGFKLKPQVRNAPLRVTIDQMFYNNIITNKTKRESLEQFFKGEKPNGKIDWHIDPHEIYYFIDQISNDKILERKPGHKWEKLDQMFTKDGIDLPQKWYRNRNKLKDIGKKGKIDELILMLSLHQ